MALNTLKCNCLTPMHIKELKPSFLSLFFHSHLSLAQAHFLNFSTRGVWQSVAQCVGDCGGAMKYARLCRFLGRGWGACRWKLGAAVAEYHRQTARAVIVSAVDTRWTASVLVPQCSRISQNVADVWMYERSDQYWATHIGQRAGLADHCRSTSLDVPLARH